MRKPGYNAEEQTRCYPLNVKPAFMSVEQSLRRHPLLALLSADQMSHWLRSGSEATFQIGETIFRQGTPGAWAYLLLDGKVRVLRTTAANKDITLGTIGPKEVFGEYALLPPGLNTATCRAAATSRLLRLPLAALADYVAKRPGVASDMKNWLRLFALIQHLRGEAFLGFMSAQSALKHLGRLESVTITASCTIQADGLSDDRWYFIDKGQVSLHGDGTSPSRQLGPGDWFGEQALLLEGTLPTAMALSEVECRTLARSAFKGEAPTAAPSSDGLQTFRQQSGPSPRFEWVGQRQPTDCGLAALAMIARCFGKAVSLDELRDRVRPGPEGLSLQSLQQLAGTIGLPSTAIRVGPQQWGQLRLPALVHLKEGHYVALFQIEMAGVQLGDPATGLVKQTLPSFRERCSGRVLVFAAMKHPAGPT